MKNFKANDIAVVVDNTTCIKFGKPRGIDLTIMHLVPIGLVCELCEERGYTRNSIAIKNILEKRYLNSTYTNLLVLRHATDRERFLYYILGVYVSGEEDESI